MTAVVAAGTVSVRADVAGPPANPESALSERDLARVSRILKSKCFDCHNSQKQQGGLDMTSRHALLEGGHSGPALVPEEPDESLMIELIEFDEMPPRKEKDKRVNKDELTLLRRWIEFGAADPPSVPESKASRTRTGKP